MALLSSCVTLSNGEQCPAITTGESFFPVTSIDVVSEATNCFRMEMRPVYMLNQKTLGHSCQPRRGSTLSTRHVLVPGQSLSRRSAHFCSLPNQWFELAHPPRSRHGKADVFGHKDR
ncbi:hypothetical protein BC567DRAFT_234717 [Phyllosticta citribraziliensis]